MAAILEEFDRRDREETGRYFKPIRPEDPNPFGGPSNDQYSFIHSTVDERWNFSGNRSGKTHGAVNDCYMFIRGEHPVRSLHRKPPVKVRFCAPKWREGIRRVIFTKLKEIVRRSDLVGDAWEKAYLDIEHTLRFKNGSTIQFKSGEEDINTYGGADLDAVYQDEHLSEAIYRENKARLTDRNGYLVSTMTPEFGQTWEWDHVNNPPEGTTIDFWFWTPFGNPHLDPEGIRKFAASIRDKALREAKLYGRFVAFGPRPLPQWNPDVHIVPNRALHPNAYRVFCIDAHPKTPCAAMWAAWEPDWEQYPGGGLVVYRTLKLFMTVPEWLKRIRLESVGEKIQEWFADEPDGDKKPDMHGQHSIIRQMIDYEKIGLPFQRVKKPPGSFNASIFKIRDYLVPDVQTHQPKIVVFESCNYPVVQIDGKWHGSLPWELDRYRFKKETTADEESLRENVVDVNNHYISDLRYIVLMEPSGKKKSTGPVFNDEPYQVGTETGLYGPVNVERRQ